MFCKSMIMDIDRLRDSIWKYLYESRSAKTVGEIAAQADCDIAAVRTAVNHEWFTVVEDRVSVAYSASS